MKRSLGMLFLLLSGAMPLLALAVPLLGLSGPVSAAVITGLTVGLPEIFLVLAGMLLGKETLNLLLGKVMGLLKRPFQPGPVPRWRYQLGLLLVLGSTLPCWILAYAPGLLAEQARIIVLVLADLLFALGFLVAGGEFWDKLRRLVTWEGL